VPCGSCAHDLVLSGAGRATIVAGNRVNDTADVLKHTLDTPEASPGEDKRLRAGILRRFIHQRVRPALINIGAFGGDSADGACQTHAEKSGRRNS
jgi:hypothetical protein